MNQLLKKKQNQLKVKKGFTLVELIIVIAIIAILAVLAIPKFSEIREDANVKADIATAKSIQSAVIVAVTNEQTGFELGTNSSTPNEIDADTIATVMNGKTLPKAKANQVKGQDFEASIDEKGNVTVLVNGIEILPNPKEPYN